MPSSVRQALETRLDGVFESAENDLRLQLPLIIQDVQMQLFQHYLHLRGRQPEPQSASNSHRSETMEAAAYGENIVKPDERRLVGPGYGLQQLGADNQDLQHFNDFVNNFDGRMFHMQAGEVAGSDLGDIEPLELNSFENILSQYTDYRSATVSFDYGGMVGTALEQGGDNSTETPDCLPP
jgi:hypothetical protein